MTCSLMIQEMVVLTPAYECVAFDRFNSSIVTSPGCDEQVAGTIHNLPPLME